MYFVRFNTDSYPWFYRLSADENHSTLNRSGTAGINLSTISAVWYRREAEPRLPSSLPSDQNHAILKEIRCFLTGIYSSLEGVPWIDPIPKIDRAEHKLPQLKVAREFGLVIPKTLMTNDPHQARRFLRKAKCPVIVKTLSPVSLAKDNEEAAVFTTMLSRRDTKALSGLRFCPMLFQHRIEKQCDIRVTIVGEDFFCVRIDSRNFDTDNTDWRRISDPANYCSSFELPKTLRKRLLQMMTYYGLSYGAIDLILTARGDFYFLELNPCGDWSWLSVDVQKKIAKSISALLQKIAKRKA